MTSFQLTSPFFDYTCDACGAEICERVQVMNLALSYAEDLYCIACLSEEEGTNAETLVESVKPYIQSRECFKTPWDNFNAKVCPLLQQNKSSAAPLHDAGQEVLTCFCQDTA